MSEIKMYLWSVRIGDANYTGMRKYIVMASSAMSANVVARNLHFDSLGNPSIDKMTTTRLKGHGTQIV